MDQIKSEPIIAILMATYNGERYIKEQLDSLTRQTYPHWHLYIHDDGSTDHTPEIIRTFAQEHPHINILEYESQKGAKDNFLSLMKKVAADYYMFADQDDVWHEEKIEISLDRMKELESQHPKKPIIVYTDLYVADAECRRIVLENVEHPPLAIDPFSRFGSHHTHHGEYDALQPRGKSCHRISSHSCHDARCLDYSMRATLWRPYRGNSQTAGILSPT